MGFGIFGGKNQQEQQAEEDIQREQSAREAEAASGTDLEETAEQSAPAEETPGETEVVAGTAPEETAEQSASVKEAPGEAEAPAELEPKNVKPSKPTRAKKRYLYVAYDQAGNFLRDEKGLLFRSGENEDRPRKTDWPEIIRERVSPKLELRVEMDPIPEGLNKKEKEEQKKAARTKAINELTRLVEEQEKAKDFTPPPDQPQKASAPSTPETVPGEAKPELIREPASKPEVSHNTSSPVPAEKMLTERIEKMVEMVEYASEKAERLMTDAKDASVQSVEVGRQVRNLTQDTKNAINRTEKTVDRIARDLDENQKRLLSKADQLKGQIRELVEPVETMEGKLKQLDKIREIQTLLENKGMILSMEIPPLNAEEEDIVNLVRYSQKITEQLGYAARELLRKQKAFDTQEQNSANERQARETELRDAEEKGVQRGRRDAVKRLVSKYEDIDTLRLAEDGLLHAVWTFLAELGVEIDGEGRFTKGTELELHAEEAERMMAQYAGVDGEGRFRVVKTGLVFQKVIILKAEFARILEPESMG